MCHITKGVVAVLSCLDVCTVLAKYKSVDRPCTHALLSALLLSCTLHPILDERASVNRTWHPIYPVHEGFSRCRTTSVDMHRASSVLLRRSAGQTSLSVYTASPTSAEIFMHYIHFARVGSRGKARRPLTSGISNPVVHNLACQATGRTDLSSSAASLPVLLGARPSPSNSNKRNTSTKPYVWQSAFTDTLLQNCFILAVYQQLISIRWYTACFRTD